MVARQGRYLEDSTFVQTAPPKYYLKDETGEYVEVSPESLGIEVDSASKMVTILSDSQGPARPVRKHPWSNADSPDIVWIPLASGDSMGVDAEEFKRQMYGERKKTGNDEPRPKRSPYDRQLPDHLTRSDTLREYRMDLNDPRHYDYVRTIVDSLIETDEANIYKAFITPADALELGRFGIPFLKTKNKPREMQTDLTKRF